MKDCVVIGKGPAGISAAIYLKRAGLDVVVVGKGYGALEKTDKIENYYGFVEPISGKELVELGLKQAERIGVEIVTDEVVSITKEEDFIVKGIESNFEAKTVLLAMGKSRKGLKVKGFEEYRGRGISFCAVCDGFFYKGKKLAVIGNGDYAIAELEELLNFSKDITLFTHGSDVTAANIPQGVEVVKEPITEIFGEQTVKGIKTNDKEYAVDGIFVAIGTAGATDFANKLGVYTDGDNIEVDAEFMTNLEGLYAAGDCVGGFLQISTAVADGANASKSIIKYVKANKK